MKIPVFVSNPRPALQEQLSFIQKVHEYLEGRGLAPRTLGVTDYDLDAPLKAIRRLMLECNGLITIAFKRVYVETGLKYTHGDLGFASSMVNTTA